MLHQSVKEDSHRAANQVGAIHLSKIRGSVLAVALLLALLLGCSEEPEGATPTSSSAAHVRELAPNQPGSRRPNIVLIVADDLGYGSLGSYGQELIETPHLDALAAEGMRFTSFYAGASSCAPSRDSIMTGRHTGHSSVRSLSTPEGVHEIPLPADSITIAKMLQSAGYSTAVIGKWGLGDVGSVGIPAKQGFDYFFGYLNHVLAHNSYPEFLWRNDEKTPLANRVISKAASDPTSEPGGYSTNKVDYAGDFITREAEDFIERNADRPFFLYLPYTAPHRNGEAPLEEQWEVPSLGRYAEMDWPYPNKSYAALVSRLDQDAGRILAKLAEEGLERDTLVIFTSDNGASDDEPTRFFNANGDLRGGKFGLYEGAIRVPMIVRWPGRIPADSESDLLSAHWDLLATSAEAAGIEDPPGTDGISMLSTMLGKPQAQTHDFLYWEVSSNGGMQAVRSNQWKAIAYTYHDLMEVYDLSSDPTEQLDVAMERPLLDHDLVRMMKAAHNPSSVFPLLVNERSYGYQIRRFISRTLKGTPSRAPAHE